MPLFLRGTRERSRGIIQYIYHPTEDFPLFGPGSFDGRMSNNEKNRGPEDPYFLADNIFS